jgi:hypothetical protein
MVRRAALCNVSQRKREWSRDSPGHMCPGRQDLDFARQSCALAPIPRKSSLVLCVMQEEHIPLREGATMDQNIMNLRQRVMATSMELIRAQRIYLDAAGKSQSELKKAAEEYLKATVPYDAALQELRQYLLVAEPSELNTMELEHTKRLIEALDKEKKVVSKLIEHHVDMNAQKVKPTSRHTEEE